MQRCAMYGSSRTTSPPQTGHFAGMRQPCFGVLTLTISGMTSPARWMITFAPTYTPFSLTCASLCIVVAHRDSAHDDGLHMRHRREHTGASDVAVDRLD